MRSIMMGLVVLASACDWVFDLERPPPPPPPPPAWIAVAAGNAHTCAIKVDQTLWCWGENGYGETGQPITSAELLVPTQVGDGLWTAVTAGYSHTCAIDTVGGLWCWGWNLANAIGADRDEAYLPVTRILDDVIAIGAGLAHTCAIRTDGSLWCWGNNTEGQLGLAPFDDQRTPLHVATDKTFGKLGVGLFHTCAITTEQALYCWGDNQVGQVVVGGSSTEFVPQMIEPATQWLDLSLGHYHTCALRTDGSLRCAGGNQFGQLGGGLTGTAQEVTTGPGRRWTRTFAGAWQSCALGDDLSLWCFGNNAQGQLATDAPREVLAPMRMSDTPGPWSTIALGGAHLCGIDTAGALWCAGTNGSGQLGSGTGGARLTPSRVEGTWSTVAVGEASVCARDMVGTVHCWGHNSDGQLADGTLHPQQRPQFVVDGASGGALAVGRFHACAATGTPSVVSCWGLNDFGQVGAGPGSEPAILQVTPTSILNPREIAAGTHTCAVTLSAGRLSCWGQNNAGQLGSPPDLVPHPSPIAEPAMNEWRAISAGLEHTCAIRGMTNSVYCWGSDEHGQLGHDQGPGAGLVSSTMSAVKLGKHHTCAIMVGDARMRCWGANADGQLGDRTTAPAQTPRPLGGATQLSWQTFALGSNHTCGVTFGQMYCWGDNARGQLGDGTRVDRNEPTRIGDAADWDLVAAGGNETCARKTDGSLWCWGANGSGQIGDSSAWAPTFVAVAP